MAGAATSRKACRILRSLKFQRPKWTNSQATTSAAAAGYFFLYLLMPRAMRPKQPLSTQLTQGAEAAPFHSLTQGDRSSPFQLTHPGDRSSPFQTEDRSGPSQTIGRPILSQKSKRETNRLPMKRSFRPLLRRFKDVPEPRLERTERGQPLTKPSYSTKFDFVLWFVTPLKEVQGRPRAAGGEVKSSSPCTCVLAICTIFLDTVS